MKTLIDKINEFESAPVQSVEEFNRIFPYCTLENLTAGTEIEIGELADSDTTRWILAGSLRIKHSFQSRKELVFTEQEEENDDSEV